MAPRSAAPLDLSEFRATVSQSYVPLNVTSDRADAFRGSIRAASLGEVQVSEVTATAHVVERTPDLIARADRKYFKLSLQLAGTGLLIQDNREALLQPGDIAVYDTEQPYSLVFEENFRMMVVMFPQTLLELPPDSVRQLAAVRFDHSAGVAGMIGPFLASMAGNLERLSGPLGTRLAHNALDLVTTMFAEELGNAPATTAHGALLERIRQYIEQHLADTDLGPSKIANAHFISISHLHGVFREQGTTVSAWVRGRRLERCRRDIADPLLADLAIGVIASRWGFTDAAHFSRLFKTTFDEPPSTLRARSIG